MISFRARKNSCQHRSSWSIFHSFLHLMSFSRNSLLSSGSQKSNNKSSLSHFPHSWQPFFHTSPSSPCAAGWFAQFTVRPRILIWIGWWKDSKAPTLHILSISSWHHHSTICCMPKVPLSLYVWSCWRSTHPSSLHTPENAWESSMLHTVIERVWNCRWA